MKSICEKCDFICNKEEFLEDLKYWNPVHVNFMHNWYGIPVHISREQLQEYFDKRFSKLAKDNKCNDFKKFKIKKRTN